MALTAVANPSGGVVTVFASGLAATTATITRTDTAGNVTAVRNGDPATLATGAWTGNDYEAPLDVGVFYQALDTSSGAVLATSATITLDSLGKFWLGHPGKPTLNISPVVKEIQPGTRKARSSTHDIIGRSLPVGQSLRRGSYSGSLAVFTRTENELNALNDLISDGNVLLMRAPASWIGYGTRYIQIGDADFGQLIRVPDGRFTVSLPWTEVSRPAGLAQSGPGYRWVDLSGGYATWLAAYTANATWNDILDGFTAPGSGGGTGAPPSAAFGTGLLTVPSTVTSSGAGFVNTPGFGSASAGTALATAPGHRGATGTGTATAATTLVTAAGVKAVVSATTTWTDLPTWYGSWDQVGLWRATWNDLVNLGAP